MLVPVVRHIYVCEYVILRYLERVVCGVAEAKGGGVDGEVDAAAVNLMVALKATEKIEY